MPHKPTTSKEQLQTDLTTVLATVEGKIDPAMAEKLKQAMDRLLEQDNKFNRDVLITSVDELLIIGDSSELNIQEIKKILKFLEKIKNFLEAGVFKKYYEYENILREEQRKVKDRIEDLREKQRMRFGR